MAIERHRLTGQTAVQYVVRIGDDGCPVPTGASRGGGLGV